MFSILDNCNIIGFDTETGTRYTATDIDFIQFTRKYLPGELHINDYSDPFEAYRAIIQSSIYISQNIEVLKEFRKNVDDVNQLELFIKDFAHKCLHPADKLKDYDLISKITYPRFGCLVGCDFENIKNFTKAQDIFNLKCKSWMILKDHSIDFIDYIIYRIRRGDNIAIITFNMEYDFNALMCNVPPTYLRDNNIKDERLPTKIHSDKTITWKDQDKNNKGCCKWVDGMLLAEKGMSIKKYGQIASNLYNNDYNKLDTYDYGKIIYEIKDLYPEPEELKYCYRDVELTLWGLSYLLRQHISTLEKCNLIARPSDLPITCSHLYDMVNVINTLDIDMNINKSKRRKFFNSYRKNNAKMNEVRYNPKDIALYQYFKYGFGGGKISFNPLFLETKIEGGNGYSLDLCSAYPFQVVNVFPNLEICKRMNERFFNTYLQKCKSVADDIRSGNFVNIIPMYKYGFTARIRIKGLIIKKGVQLPLMGNLDGACHLTGDFRIIRNRIISADSIDITVTHADLITYMAGYEYDDISLISGYVYPLKPMNGNLRKKFTTAAKYKSEIKKWTKKDYKEIIKDYKDFNALVGQDLLTGKEKEPELVKIIADAYQNSKVLFNGIYGKACQSLIHNKKYIDDMGEIHITEDKYKPRQGTCYTTGRYIATYTRLHLCELFFIAQNVIDKEDLILYAHTDSLKLYVYDNGDKKTNKIMEIFNKGINDEYDYFLKNNLNYCYNETITEIFETLEDMRGNGIGYVEEEVQNRFIKAIVCGNMRILTEDDKGNCHITFSGVNVNYVLSGGKDKYKPNELKEYMQQQGIFLLYYKYFATGRKYTIFESCKTTLDYKHYNLILNEDLGHICQTIKELPIEINGDKEQIERDNENIKWMEEYYAN